MLSKINKSNVMDITQSLSLLKAIRLSIMIMNLKTSIITVFCYSIYKYFYNPKSNKWNAESDVLNATVIYLR